MRKLLLLTILLASLKIEKSTIWKSLYMIKQNQLVYSQIPVQSFVNKDFNVKKNTQ